ncbi:acyl carrier protein [Tabrizicola sp.]|uniref:acyl carrier protein n=1 Tax=Tabrizicola sp. TaxID=2005166 RepID=UPI0027374154|nr:acyl carrier protein [Tabrizicola sp.]MDP3195900.1 acyl carrier protein [Tabrizicola sp.]
MSVVLPEDLVEILRDHFRVDISKLDPKTRVNRDLGIDGDDALELLEMIETRMGRRIDLDFARYFSGENLFSGWKEDLSLSKLAELMATPTMNSDPPDM